MQARWHQKVPRALGARGGDDRRLKLAKPLIPHPAAHRGDNIGAHFHVLLQLLPAQIEIAVLQSCLFGIFLLAKHHQGQLLRSAQNLQVADEHLNLSGWNFGVHQFRVAGFDRAINPNAPFATQFFHLFEHRAVRVTKHLCHPIMIAQIDEEQTAMVAHAMHPSRKANGLANIFDGQVGTGVAAIGMHGSGSFKRSR